MYSLSIYKSVLVETSTQHSIYIRVHKMLKKLLLKNILGLNLLILFYLFFCTNFILFYYFIFLLLTFKNYVFYSRRVQTDDSASTDSWESGCNNKPSMTDRFDDEVAKKLANSVSSNLRTLDSVSRECLVKDIIASDATNTSGSAAASEKRRTLERSSNEASSGKVDKNEIPTYIKQEQGESLSISDTLSEIAEGAFSREVDKPIDQATQEISPDIANAVANQTGLYSESETSSESGVTCNRSVSFNLTSTEKSKASCSRNKETSGKKIKSKKLTTTAAARTPADKWSSTSTSSHSLSHPPSTSSSGNSSEKGARWIQNVKNQKKEKKLPTKNQCPKTEVLK